jgi:hypothetical protein
MTTIIPFTPSNIRAPTYRATLDGNDYNIVVTWNVSAKRYYINVYTLNGLWIITTALVSSPPGRAVESAVYDPFLNAVEVTLVDPYLWPCPLPGPVTKPGTMVDYTLDNFQPNTYNGKFRCLHLTLQKFTFPMPTDPGPLIVLGRVNRVLSMVDTVFKRSTLIYRNGAFEISP